MWRGGLRRALLSCGLLMALGVSVSAQTLEQAASQPHRWGYLTVSTDARWKALSAAEAADFEQQLRDDPENVRVRADLLNYYWHNDRRSQRVDSICWLIEHHPDSPILGLDLAWIFPDRMPYNDAADFERAQAVWESTLNPIAVPLEAPHNAARFFETSDLDKSVDLARRLQKLDPAGHTKPVAYFYGLVLAGQVGPSRRLDRITASLPLFEELVHSSDVSLVGSVADELVSYGSNAAIQKENVDLSFVCVAAFRLIDRAQQLEPQNSHWADLLEGAKQLPCALAPTPQITVNPGARPGTIAVSGPVQAARLIQPVAPDNSPARQAGVTGVVRCRVRIGKDGHVIDVQVISGNPLLVQPAIEALKQYIYSPTLLNGSAVEVETTVDIPFQAN